MTEKILVTRMKTEKRVETRETLVQRLQETEEQLDIFSPEFNPEAKLVPVYDTVVTTDIVNVTDKNTFLTQEMDRVAYDSLVGRGLHTGKLNPNVKRLLDLGNPIYQMSQEEIHTLYSVFKIPKSSGGFRTIKAPNHELKTLQRQYKYVLEEVLSVLPHNSAHAYIRGRSVNDALKVHQENESHWFLKIDLKNFFDNCTPEFVYKQLRMIHPFASWTQEDYDFFLSNMEKIAFLDNGLPQGTPLSPTLTNLIMVEFDKWMTSYAYKYALRYTRYADDMLISSKYQMDWRKVEQDIFNYMKENDYPFKINAEKTRYGSSAGSNWNLGLMLNKDNNITIGHKNKRKLKRMMFFFIKNNNPKTYKSGDQMWNYAEVSELNGHLEWLRANEPENYEALITWFNKKHNVNIKQLIKDRLRAV